MTQQPIVPNEGRRLGRSGVLFPFARRSVRVPLLVSVALAAALVVGVGCDSAVAPESGLAQAGDDASAAPMNARGSWNNWHVHDGGSGTDENGLRHAGTAVFPTLLGVTTQAYVDDPSLHVYCPDGVDHGVDGGSKRVAGTCRNDGNLIHLQDNLNDAPAPAGWTAVPWMSGFVYYRLTPR